MEFSESNGKKAPKVMAHPTAAEIDKAHEDDVIISRAMDPELRAMQQITKILKDLDVRAQTRVITWVTEKIFAARHPQRPSEMMASSLGLDVSKKMDY